MWETIGKQLVYLIRNGSPLNVTEALQVLEAMSDPHILVPEIVKYRRRRIHHEQDSDEEVGEEKGEKFENEKNHENGKGIERGDEKERREKMDLCDGMHSIAESKELGGRRQYSTVNRNYLRYNEFHDTRRLELELLMMSSSWQEVAGYISAFLVSHSDEIADNNKLIDILWKLKEASNIVYMPLLLKIQSNLLHVRNGNSYTKLQLSLLLQPKNIGRLFQLLHIARWDTNMLALSTSSLSSPFVLAASTDSLDPVFAELVESAVTASKVIEKNDSLDDLAGLIVTVSHGLSTPFLREGEPGLETESSISATNKITINPDVLKLQAMSRRQLTKLLWAATQPNKHIAFEVSALISIVKELHRRSWKREDILCNETKKNGRGVYGYSGASIAFWDDVAVTLRALLDVERRINSVAIKKQATEEEIEKAVLLVQLHRRLLLGTRC